MHLNSLLIFREHLAPHISHDDHVLEIGPDSNPSSYWVEAGKPPSWHTADLAEQAGAWSRDQSKSKVMMPSEYQIPVDSDAYDVVFSAQVIEHVRQIWTWMQELARVTRPGGCVMTISPVSWTYHEAPVDCWRIYPSGMQALCETAGLTVQHCWWGSLEPKRSRRTYPGIGTDWKREHSGPIKHLIQRAVGWPLPVSYDMVTVARKPDQAQATGFSEASGPHRTQFIR